MTKIGRNESCPLRERQKYKNCCLGEPENQFLKRLKINLAKMWSYDRVNEMSDAENYSPATLVLNVPFDKNVS